MIGGGLLALLSGVVYGGADFVGGLASRTVRTGVVLLVSHVAALAVIGAWVALVRPALPDLTATAFAALAGLGEVLALGAVYRGLARGRAGVVAPLGAMAPVVAVLAGLALGETPTALQLAGMLVVLVGVAAVAASGAGGGGRGSLRASLAYGGVGALGHGVFFVAMDLASEDGVAWALLGARTTSVAVLVALALVIGQRVRVPGRWRLGLPGLGVLIVLGDSAYALATTRGLVGVVAVLSSLYPVITVALARTVLADPVTRSQWAGVVLSVLGVALVSAGGG